MPASGSSYPAMLYTIAQADGPALQQYVKQTYYNGPGGTVSSAAFTPQAVADVANRAAADGVDLKQLFQNDYSGLAIMAGIVAAGFGGAALAAAMSGGGAAAGGAAAGTGLAGGAMTPAGVAIAPSVDIGADALAGGLTSGITSAGTLADAGTAGSTAATDAGTTAPTISSLTEPATANVSTGSLVTTPGVNATSGLSTASTPSYVVPGADDAGNTMAGMQDANLPPLSSTPTVPPGTSTGGLPSGSPGLPAGAGGTSIADKVLNGLGNAAPILGSMAQSANQSNIQNAANQVKAADAYTAQQKYALTAPSVRQQQALHASLSNAYTPVQFNWGGPGSVAAGGPLPSFSGGIVSGLQANAKDNQALNLDIIKQVAQNQASNTDMNNPYLLDKNGNPVIGQTSTANQVLGGLATAANLAKIAKGFF